MSGEKKNPAIDYIYDTVGNRRDAGMALRDIEASLRVAAEKQVPVIEPFAVVKPAFRPLIGRYSVFDGDSPPVALAKAIAVETGIPAPPNIALVEADAPEQAEATVLYVAKKRKPETDGPLRVSAVVREGELYISAGKIRREEYPDITEKKFNLLVAGLPSISAISANGRPVLLYSASPVHEVAKEWQKVKERRADIRRLKREGPGKLDRALWIDSYSLADIYDIPQTRVVALLGDTSSTRHRSKRFFLRGESAPILTKYVSEKKSEEGIYYRDGEAKVTLHYLHNRYGFSYPFLRDRLSGLAPVQDKASGQVLFSLEGASKIIQKIEGIPQVDKNTWTYRDEDGKEWATETTLARSLGISSSKIKTYTLGEAKLPIRAVNNRATVGYQVDVIEEKAIDFSSLPREDDPDIVQYYSRADELADEWDLPHSSVRSVLAGTGIRVRGVGGRRKVYEKRTADDHIHSFLSFPAVDDQLGVVVTASGEAFGQQMSLKTRLGIHPGLWEEIAGEEASIPFMVARRGTEPVIVYNIADVEAYVDYRKTHRKKPDREYHTAEYNLPSAIEAEAARLVAAGVELRSGNMAQTNKTFKNRVERRYPGGFRALRVKIGLDKPKEPKPVRKVIHWEKMKEPEIVAELESQARDILAKGEALNHTSLRKNGYSGFSANVSGRYPGGMDALRRKLGIEVEEKTRSWKEVKDPKVEIQGILYDIVVAQQSLSTDNLKQLGLLEAVYRRYPGGYQQVLVDFGIDGLRRSADKMTPKAILAEARALRNDHHYFSTTLAERVGKLDLVTAIRHHYPGGVDQLMKDMGDRPNRTAWTPRLMEREAAKIYRANGRISNSLLGTVQGLRLAVYRHYPGGLEALKAKVIPSTEK